MKSMFLFAILGMACGLSCVGDASQSKDLQAGDQVKFTVNGVDFEFVWCPPGTFRMGDKNSKRTVVLTRGFWIGKYEVTFEQWRVILGRFPQPYTVNTETMGKSEDLRGFPVNQISWLEGQGFVYVMNKKLGEDFGFRYPTEAEWEYACRAGSQNDVAGTGRLEDMSQEYVRNQRKVGQKQPNEWGIFDMHGNVTEWCYDYFQEFSESSDVVVDPMGPSLAPSTAGFRVCRDGETCHKREHRYPSFEIDPITLWPKYDVINGAHEHNPEVGIRVASCGDLKKLAGKSIGDPIDVKKGLEELLNAQRKSVVMVYNKLLARQNQLDQVKLDMMRQSLIQQQQANQMMFNSMQQQVYDNLNRIEAAHSTAITPMPQSHKPYRARCYIHNCDYQIPGSCPYCSAPDYGAGKMVPCAKHGHKYNTKYACPLCRAESR